MPYAEAEFVTLESKIKITYSKKQINKNYVHIPVSRNPTYSLCNLDDAYGISSLQSLDVVQFRSISPGKEASNIHKGKCPKKYSACRGYLWKTITERKFKNKQWVFFFDQTCRWVTFLVTTFMMKKEKKYLPLFDVFKHVLFK